MLTPHQMRELDEMAGRASIFQFHVPISGRTTRRTFIQGFDTLPFDPTAPTYEVQLWYWNTERQIWERRGANEQVIENYTPVRAYPVIVGGSGGAGVDGTIGAIGAVTTATQVTTGDVTWNSTFYPEPTRRRSNNYDLVHKANS